MDSLETKVCHEWSEPIMTLDQQWYPPPPPSSHCRCVFHWYEHWSHLPGHHTGQRDYTKVIGLPHLPIHVKYTTIVQC